MFESSVFGWSHVWIRRLEVTFFFRMLSWPWLVVTCGRTSRYLEVLPKYLSIYSINVQASPLFPSLLEKSFEVPHPGMLGFPGSGLWALGTARRRGSASGASGAWGRRFGFGRGRENAWEEVEEMLGSSIWVWKKPRQMLLVRQLLGKRRWDLGEWRA